MPSTSYALEEGGEKRLEVSWQRGWKKVSMRLDGAELAVIEDKADLKRGKKLALPDGSSLDVRLTRKGLELVRGGEPLPGSTSSPEQAVTKAVVAVFWIGGGNLLLGILSALKVFDLSFSWQNIISGFVFLLLGYYVRRRSAPALGVAILLTTGIFVWNLSWFIRTIAAGGVPLGIGGLVITVVFLVWMIHGFKAIRSIEARRGTTAGATDLTCSECGVTISADDEVCPSCGENFEE